MVDDVPNAPEGRKIPQIPNRPVMTEPQATRARRPKAPEPVIAADRILWRNVFAFGALIIMGAATIVVMVLVVLAVFQQYGRYNAIQDAYNRQQVCQIRGDC